MVLPFHPVWLTQVLLLQLMPPLYPLDLQALLSVRYHLCIMNIIHHMDQPVVKMIQHQPNYASIMATKPNFMPTHMQRTPLKIRMRLRLQQSEVWQHIPATIIIILQRQLYHIGTLSWTLYNFYIFVSSI